MKIQKIVIIALITIITGSFYTCKKITEFGKTIKPSHPYINYIGRFDFSDPLNVAYDFPGVYFRMRFTGQSLAVLLDDTSNYYNVVLDNQKTFVITPRKSTFIRIARGMKDTIHTVKIYKRTEALVGKGVFKGFMIDSDGQILQYKNIRKRKIEYIGNSITCGYGNEGAYGEGFKASTENSYYSYASFLARKFNADYCMVAYSGKGLVRNYNDSLQQSAEPLPDLYNRKMVSKPDSRWNFSNWSPDLVVINLGTNDFSTKPYPDSTYFAREYENLINRIRILYPPLHIVCVCGPIIGEPCCSQIKSVVKNYREVYGFKNLHFVSIPSHIIKRNDDLGADAHPNVYGQKKMADYLVPRIAKIMEWDE